MKRHRTDLLSMFSGLVFLGLGGVFVTGRVDATDLDAQWLWPMPLIIGGLFIFLAAFRSEPEPEGEVASVDEVTDPEPAIGIPRPETADDLLAESPIDEPADEVRADHAATDEASEAIDEAAEPVRADENAAEEDAAEEKPRDDGLTDIP